MIIPDPISVKVLVFTRTFLKAPAALGYATSTSREMWIRMERKVFCGDFYPCGTASPKVTLNSWCSFEEMESRYVRTERTPGVHTNTYDVNISQVHTKSLTLVQLCGSQGAKPPLHNGLITISLLYPFYNSWIS